MSACRSSAWPRLCAAGGAEEVQRVYSRARALSTQLSVRGGAHVIWDRARCKAGRQQQYTAVLERPRQPLRLRGEPLNPVRRSPRRREASITQHSGGREACVRAAVCIRRGSRYRETRRRQQIFFPAFPALRRAAIRDGHVANMPFAAATLTLEGFYPRFLPGRPRPHLQRSTMATSRCDRLESQRSRRSCHSRHCSVSAMRHPTAARASMFLCWN